MNVYLDHAATTPLDGEVFEKMLPLLKENFGNPDSLHTAGRRAAYAVSLARDSVAKTLGVKPNEVYFTSGGTEADNWAVRCLGEGRACVSAIEHAAVRSAAILREGGFGEIGVSADGIVTADNVANALTQDTNLVCVMAVNNETGCIQPIEEISALCSSRGVLLFSDCVQAACTLDLKEIIGVCDAISLSAHKIGGPKGTGVLVVKNGVKMRSLIVGGEQERSLRGGTLNVAGAVGFAAALEKAQRAREEFAAHTLRLRDLFEKIVLQKLGKEAIVDGANRVPNISHITFEKSGEWLLSALDLKGVCASGGAACSAHAALPSHVLTAMGRSEQEAKRGVRFSFGRETTEEEAIFAANAVIECLKK
ncbi:MAG: cysteine desulfurase [Clostridiales bacterium]|nr:cysteine desulfurase [Clostridiales bacterium]